MISNNHSWLLLRAYYVPGTYIHYLIQHRRTAGGTISTHPTAEKTEAWKSLVACPRSLRVRNGTGTRVAISSFSSCWNKWHSNFAHLVLSRARQCPGYWRGKGFCLGLRFKTRKFKVRPRNRTFPFMGLQTPPAKGPWRPPMKLHRQKAVGLPLIFAECSSTACLPNPLCKKVFSTSILNSPISAHSSAVLIRDGKYFLYILLTPRCLPFPTQIPSSRITGSGQDHSREKEFKKKKKKERASIFFYLVKPLEKKLFFSVMMEKKVCGNISLYSFIRGNRDNGFGSL